MKSKVEIATLAFEWLQSIYQGDMTTYHEIYDSLSEGFEQEYFNIMLAFAMSKLFEDMESEFGSMENLEQFSKEPSLLALSKIDHPTDDGDEWK